MALSFSIVLLIRNANLQRQEDAVQSELDALNSEGYYTEIEAQKLVENAKIEAEESTKNSIRQMIQERLENGDSATTAIRALFPDQIVVASSGRYYFFPILDTIEHHGFNEEDFVEGADGFLEYVGDDSTVEIKKGVDVSRFQGAINWEKVKNAGVDFAIIRCGFRGQSVGKIYEDAYFKTNVSGAAANGIKVGIYFYSTAINENEAFEEAAWVISKIKTYRITYPVVYDFEDFGAYRCSGVGGAQATSNAHTYLNLVRSAGYEPMMYANKSDITSRMSRGSFSCKFWLAHYTSQTDYKGNYNMLNISI